MAEGIFQHLVDEAGLSDSIAVDSAGTGSYHVGEQAHSGTANVLASHGISYDGRARQIAAGDVGGETRYLVAMDGNNVRDLRRRFGRDLEVVRLLDFASRTEDRNVPDPYYTGNFEYVFDLVEDGCQGLLAEIRQRESL